MHEDGLIDKAAKAHRRYMLQRHGTPGNESCRASSNATSERVTLRNVNGVIAEYDIQNGRMHWRAD
jgi:hypothetical protein